MTINTTTGRELVGKVAFIIARGAHSTMTERAPLRYGERKMERLYNAPISQHACKLIVPCMLVILMPWPNLLSHHFGRSRCLLPAALLSIRHMTPLVGKKNKDCPNLVSIKASSSTASASLHQRRIGLAFRQQLRAREKER